ncbi:MAG: aminotransferase class I/II-fold pyridoxal phosphate-dependent enzyme [Chloroflexi bacterium]|nr:aminotransferase class I/II-fold pyridoxal phosphate-dependent enzyme [Chloroflexota bacterium]
MDDELDFATRCIHAGVEPDLETGAVKRPLVMANSYQAPFDFRTDPNAKMRFGYAREHHPNGYWLEQRLAAMEEGEACVVTASGVAAINGTLFSLLSRGDHVVASATVYVAVRDVLLNHFPQRFGIDSTLVDTADAEAVRRAITPRTKLIHIETPGNPTTRISDIAAIARIASEAGIPLMVDSTWAGPALQHPLKLGATLVAHSLSKYINGHGDAIGGCVIGPSEIIERIRRFAIVDLGSCISPFNAWQIMRGSATLPLRMEKHCANALKVAQFLESHPKVAWVRYPGLASHPQHAIAVKQMDGFSGMLNFDIKGDPARRPDFLRKLKVFTHATCLGHDESLIMVYEWDDEKFFRVSVGIESADDLIADLGQALDAV